MRESNKSKKLVLRLPSISCGTDRLHDRGVEKGRDDTTGIGNDLKSIPPDQFHTGCSKGIGWLVGCLTSQQHARVSQGRICTDNFTCCHTEIEAADQTFHLTQSQYTDTGPTSPSADLITPGAWQGSHWSANV